MGGRAKERRCAAGASAGCRSSSFRIDGDCVKRRHNGAQFVAYFAGLTRMKGNIDPNGERAAGQCLCGKVRVEIDVPARWAWHDHTLASRLAHGAAYATYVGSWRSRFRVTSGVKSI